MKAWLNWDITSTNEFKFYLTNSAETFLYLIKFNHYTRYYYHYIKDYEIRAAIKWVYKIQRQFLIWIEYTDSKSTSTRLIEPNH